MGSIKLREALRCLCDEIGWSYAVFWRSVGSESSMHLVWEDGHVVENRMKVLVHKIMAQQVFLLGEGIVGQAAATGCHQWVVTDNIHVNAPGSKDLAELEHQFSAGIQTVTVIPLLTHGVLQLGCTQMVMENIRFVNHVKNLFGQLDCVTGSLLPDMSQKALSQNSQLLNRIPVVVSEMLLDQLTITNTSVPLSDAFQPIIYPVCEQNLHVNSQSETRPLGDQRILCNSDMSLIPSAFTHDSTLKYQYQRSPLTSGLSSISLPLPEQQLAMFSINSWEATNGIGPESDITNAFPISSHGLIFPDSIKVSNIPSLSRSDTGDSANALGRFSSRPGSTREASSSPYPNLSSTDVVQMLSLSHLQSCHGILIDASPSYLSVNTSEPATTAGSQKQEHGLCTTCDVPSIESDINGHYNQALLSTLKECRLSSSNAFLEDQRYNNAISDANSTKISQGKLNIKDNDESKYHHVIPMQSTSGSDLYDILGPDYKIDRFGGNFDDVLENKNDVSSHELAADNSTCMAQLDVCPVTHSLDDSVSGLGMVSIADANQLLDAMVSKINSGIKENSDDGVYQRTSITNTCSSSAPVVSSCNKLIASDRMQGKSLSLPLLGKVEVLGSSSSNSACSLGNITDDCYQSAGICKSQISLWVENGQTMHANNLSDSQSKKTEEKPYRKRARPGENPRPRPKDRQMIMDRVKELREIIPNGAKCSIDGLLEKTIKHMLFLQSVTKHADNLKDIGEPKFISKEGGILLKEKFEGGATFAFQVGSQSMTCPIIVEDLNPPRQMLVEMLCEQRGVFLEIADLIRGLGLTILKGVMEAHQDKIWARFAVEANRDVTRMEIFRSIVRMLESTVGSGTVPQGVDNINMQHNICHQSCVAATGTSTQLL